MVSRTDACDRPSGHPAGRRRGPRAEATRLGWLPSPLLDYVRAVMSTGGANVTVVRANPPSFGHHLRLLVRIDGRTPEGYALPWRPTCTGSMITTVRDLRRSVR